jgi:SPASM domain peptide maturase of grasp-with-spasm system
MVPLPILEKSKFKLYSNVIPVSGFKKGILCDLFRNQIFQLPKDLIDILESYNEISLSILTQAYGKDNEEVLRQYLSFLVERKLVFTAKESTFPSFNDFNIEWDKPSIITNAQIVIGKHTCINKMYEILKELEILGCKAILFILVNVSLADKCDVLEKVDNDFEFIFDVLLDYAYNNHDCKLIDCAESFKKVINIKICNSTIESIEKSLKYNYLTFSWLKMPLKEMPCSIINNSSFNPSMEFFCEARSYNSCLNRKVCIDQDLGVSNCFAMTKSFGNVMKGNLGDIIKYTKLSEAWNISKDKIESCRDCEYRYVCHDCRAFLEDMNNLFSKPAKCKYNPYTGKWGN